MAEANFIRNSIAYNADGSVVQANQPRFQAGKFGNGILLEEGTTNIITNANGCPTSLTSGGSTPPPNPVLITDNTNPFGTQCWKVTFPANSTANGYAGTRVITNGGLYTINLPYVGSCWVKGDMSNITIYPTGGHALANLVATGHSINGWYEYKANSAVNPTSNGTDYITFYLNKALTQDLTFYVAACQIEQKSYCTSIINGTRQGESLTLNSKDVLSEDGSWTIECSGKTNVASGVYRMIFDAWPKFYLALEPSNLVVLSWTDGTQKVYYSSTPLSNPTGWHDWAYVRDGTTHKVYIDGVKYIEGTGNLSSLFPTTFRIASWSGYNWNGVVDDFRISKIARSDFDIANAYNSNLPLPIDPYTTCKMNFDGNLAYNAYFTDISIVSKNKFLKIFDKSHKILDEIGTFDNLIYGWTLDDIDTLEFNLGLEDEKCTDINMLPFNHVEIWDNTKCYWGGILAGRSFEGAKLKVNCVDYMFLLKVRRLRVKTYPSRDYGTLMTLLINDVNNIEPTGVSIGSIATGALQTTRIVQNTDFLLDKIKNFNADVNYDFDVDINRSFNFYLRKGTNKFYYTLEYGGVADNILEAPMLSQDILSMANSVCSEIQNNGAVSLSSLAQDSYSQSLYGLVEGTYSANTGVTEQSTLDNQCNGALQRSAYPTSNFTIKAKDSTLCPFNDIQVGDSVTVSLVPYFGFKALMRIIRMVHNENTGVRDITFGEIIYKPQPPIKRLYKKG